MKLGDRVIYTCHDEHALEDGGSIHHPEQTEFAGLVTRVRDDGSCDVTIFPPNKEAKPVDAVSEGTGSHTIRHAD